MLNSEFDPTRPEDWTVANGKAIAKALGYEYNQAFEEVLKDFIERVVLAHKNTEFLMALAEKVFTPENNRKLKKLR